MRRFLLAALLTFSLCAAAQADRTSIELKLPANVKVDSAVAVAGNAKVEIPGKIDGPTIHFEKLLPDTPYNIKLTLADGTTVQGVDLNWYDEEPAKPDAEPMDDADRKEINSILQLPSFYNHTDILFMNGDHTRATALVQLVRDKDFVEGGGQVVWRVELYYFKEQFGGWEKVLQQDKIIRRERFKSHADYQSALSKTRFAPSIGGIRLDGEHPQKTIKLDPKDVESHPTPTQK